MRCSKTLPSASPRTVYHVIAEILQAGKDSVFSQKTLKDKGVGSNRQGLTLMRWLNLLTPSGMLKEDVLDHRGESDLTQLLRERLKTALVEIGCEPDAIAGLGCGHIPDRRLDELLHSLPPVKAATQPTVASNMTSCLRAVHSVLEHACERAWLERELRALEARRGPSPCGKPLRSREDRPADGPSHDPRSQRSDSDTTDAEAGSRDCVSENQEPHATDFQSLINSVGIVAEPLVVGFKGNDPLYEYVYYPEHLNGDQLEKLARQLLNKARAKQGLNVPCSGPFRAASCDSAGKF